MNVWIHDQEVDAVWDDRKVAVLLDGWEFHRTGAAFERDRRRQAALTLHGYRVLPLTYRRLLDEPAAVVGEVRQVAGAGSSIARRPRAAAPSSSTECSMSSANSSRSAIAS